MPSATIHFLFILLDYVIDPNHTCFDADKVEQYKYSTFCEGLWFLAIQVTEKCEGPEFV